MAVKDCQGEGCNRYISISIHPGGNPTALEDPETWATEYRLCRKCGAGFCDRCLKKMSSLSKKATCTKCGGELYKPSTMEEFFKLQFGE